MDIIPRLCFIWVIKLHPMARSAHPTCMPGVDWLPLGSSQGNKVLSLVKGNGGKVARRPRVGVGWLMAGAAMLVLIVACGAASTPSPLPLTSPGGASTGGAGGTSDAAGPQSASPAGSTPTPHATTPADSSSNPIGQPSAVAVPVPSPLPAAGQGVPKLDTSIHDVPLGDIVFDTFNGRFVPLDQASEDLILSLRDAISPVGEPVYGGLDALPWLQDSDLVMGYVSGEDAYAYPINVLNFHEIVNDEINGLSVLITYCPLCFSGVVFNRELDGRLLTFGNTSALYQSDLVMYDHQTGSYWFQVGGEAVVGTLTGSTLNVLPSATMAWGHWKDLYPQTRLLAGTAGSPTAFTSNRFSRGFSDGYQARINSGSFAFPVDQEKVDGRLPAGEIVLTVEVGEDATAFPLEPIGDGAVNSRVGGQPVVVFALSGSRAAAAFSPVVDGRELTFDFQEDVQSFVDRETGSGWDPAGRSISGPMEGAQLNCLNTRRAFWFSIAIALPGVHVYQP